MTILNTAPYCAVAFLISAGCQSIHPGPETTSATFDSKGTTIRFLAAGEGEPIVLLHGWMSEASHWGPGTRQSPKLSPPIGYRVIAPDLRGHGLSGKPHAAAAYGAAMAADVVRLLDHLKIKKAHLVGYSMGSFVAAKVVDLAPDRVVSVTYGGGGPILSTRSVKGFSDAESFARAVEAGTGLGQYVIDTYPAGLKKPSLPEAEKIADRLFGHLDVRAIAASGRSFGALEVDVTRIKKLAVPTQFVYGEQESSFVHARIGEAIAAMPFAKTVAIPDANHLTTLPNPKFGKAIMDFIKANPLR